MGWCQWRVLASRVETCHQHRRQGLETRGREGSLAEVSLSLLEPIHTVLGALELAEDTVVSICEARFVPTSTVCREWLARHFRSLWDLFEWEYSSSVFIAKHPIYDNTVRTRLLGNSRWLYWHLSTLCNSNIYSSSFWANRECWWIWTEMDRCGQNLVFRVINTVTAMSNPSVPVSSRQFPFLTV